MAMVLVAASAGFTQESQPGPTSVRVRNVKLESLKLHESRHHAPRDESAREDARGDEAQPARSRDLAGPHHAQRDAYSQERSIWKQPGARPVSYAKAQRDGGVRRTAAEELQLSSPRNHVDGSVRRVSRLREVLQGDGLAPYQQQPSNEDPPRDPLKESLAEGPSTPFDCPEQSELTRPIRQFGELSPRLLVQLQKWDPETKKFVLVFDANGAPVYDPNAREPRECGLFEDAFSPRHWQCLTFYWKASAVCHKPLYFEEETLERYGHSTGPFLEPFVSGAHFFACVVTLPYHMGIDHPCECIYPLGYYRPGDCAPQMVYPLPLSARGALYQGAAVTGLVFLIP